MYGFTITKGLELNNHSNRFFECNGYLCENNMLNKFENDKIFFENENYIVILDGFILNKKELQETDWYSTIIKLYEDNGVDFCHCLRGTFAGALYDKREKLWIIFTDHLGQKFIYYALVEDKFICSSYIDEIYRIFKENGIDYQLDENGAMFLLTYGFMLENYTLCDKIKKIQPGCYITYKEGVIEEKRYFQLDNEPNNLSYQENIERLEELFCKAVEKEYNKDKEYGYEHVCALSGGLDCRMTSFVAHELGYKKQLNVTFSQSDYWDEVIPKQIARDLHHEWLFKSLDNGMFLFDADYITKRTGGNVLYYATAFSDSLCRYINWSNLGMFHSGQIGDCVIGSPCRNYAEVFSFGDGAYSNSLVKEINLYPYFTYKNKDIALWYYRYLNGTNNGIQNVYNYTEFSSPFCELDFLTFCLSIPLEYRYNHKIYKDWICMKHPDAANYVWQTTGAYINEPILNILGREIPKSQVKMRFKRKVGKIFGRRVEEERWDGMNPLQKYLDENEELKPFYDSYKIYLDKIHNKKLKQYVSQLMDFGNAYEKNMALTLLAAVKAYF